MFNYQGKKVVIIGLGITGISCLNFFLKRGVVPRVMDTRLVVPKFNKNLYNSIKCCLGKLNIKWLLSADLIVISPGIVLPSNLFNLIFNIGIEIIGDIELFCREARAPIVAITGSNGKSTVTTLIGEIAKFAGINVGIGGNIGLPALYLLNRNHELYILEISSFQLESTYSLQSIVAVILNITENHMDRYPYGMEQYCKIKLRVYKNAKTCIVNSDDLHIAKLFKKTNSSIISFGRNHGEYHLYSKHGETWLCVKNKMILNVKDLKIVGKHNHLNSLVALAIADVLDIPRLISIRALNTFSGLNHRFQLIFKKDNISWINDSKSTSVSSTKAALDNLCDITGTIHLLLGGYGKSANFSSLKPYLLNKKIQLYCFGYNREELATLYPEITVKTNTLEQAMYLLSFRIRPGDVVLLSPACSSLDQFKNFEHRGLLFNYLAKKLG